MNRFEWMAWVYGMVGTMLWAFSGAAKELGMRYEEGAFGLLINASPVVLVLMTAHLIRVALRENTEFYKAMGQPYHLG